MLNRISMFFFKFQCFNLHFFSLFRFSVFSCIFASCINSSKIWVLSFIYLWNVCVFIILTDKAIKFHSEAINSLLFVLKIFFSFNFVSGALWSQEVLNFYVVIFIFPSKVSFFTNEIRFSYPAMKKINT